MDHRSRAGFESRALNFEFPSVVLPQGRPPPCTPNTISRKRRNGVFFSGRFDGAFKEKVIRDVAQEVRSRAPFVPVLIVDASHGQGAGYGVLTMSLLAQTELMVPFVFDDYGQWTGNPYCTFAEVTYCLEHKGEVECLPLKLYSTKRWPPVPADYGGGFRGAAQNEFFFKTDLLYKEFPVHNEAELLASKAAMADSIIDRYLELNPDLRHMDDRRVQAPSLGTSLPPAGVGRTLAVGQDLKFSLSEGCWLPSRVEKPLGGGGYGVSMAGQHIPATVPKGGDQRYSPAVFCTTLKAAADKMPFSAGDLAEYVSSSGSATNCKVLSVDGDGCYLDIDPISKVPFSSLRPRKHEAFKAGDAVLYMSVTNGAWIQTKVLHAHGNGHYQTEAKPGCLVPQELLKGVQATEEATSLHSPTPQKNFAIGQRVMYMMQSRECGTCVACPTVVRAANDDGTYEIMAQRGSRVAASLLWAVPGL